VKSIGDLWPGNPVINEWLDALANGTANVPTKKQIDTAARLAQQNSSFWDFGNPSPPPELISGFNLSTLAPFFHQQWTALGFNPPPLATDPAPATDPLQQQPLLGGATLDSIPQGSEGQQNGPNTGVQQKVDPNNVLASSVTGGPSNVAGQNGPNTGVQQKVDPNNVLASSVTGGPSNVAGKFDNLSKAVDPDVGKPTLTPTSLRNGLSIADESLAGPAEPPKTRTESTGKDGNGSANNSSNGGTESGSPRHAKQSETGPRHAKSDNDNDSSGGTTTAAAGANTGRTPTKTP
jgi:hypothetical protein